MPRHWPAKRIQLYSIDKTHELTEAEKTRFAELVEVAQKSIDAFRLFGAAMNEIKERRLYREKYTTWNAYLKAEWGLSRQHVDQQIAASNFATIVDEVSDNVLTSSACQIIPKLTARVASELAKVARNTNGDSRALVSKAMSIASATGKITAKTMKMAVDHVAPPKAKAAKSVQKAQGSIEALAKPFSSIIADLRAIGRRINDLGLSKLQSVSNAISEVQQWTPTEICSDCEKEKSCLTCSGKGWLGKWQVEARRKGAQ